MKFTPRPFQDIGIKYIVDFLQSAAPGDKRILAAPTGVGKSVVELGAQELVNSNLDNNCWIVTPREEIIRGMLDKLGASADADSMDYRISTPIRLRNRLLRGEIEHPKQLLVDEGHHSEASTYKQLDLLAGLCPAVALTATPYRGSAKGTRDLLETWGEPQWLISLQEAAAEGYISLPYFEVLPLVDDDVVEIGTGGEFEVVSIDSATLDRLADMAEHSRAWYKDSLWDRPTLFSMPTTACCKRLQAELLKRGLPCAMVVGGTPQEERQQAFEALKARVLAVLHIQVVSEGVDLPVRRLVDLAPTMSPVKWLQQLGRATRPVAPGEPPPVYVGTNRNLLRHAYTLEGAVPQLSIANAEQSFGGTSRPHVRVLGLESLGRFKPTNVKLMSGINISMYNLSCAVNGVVVEYCVLVHPCMDAVWASKVNTVDSEGRRQWGDWRACDAPSDMRGFGSVSPRELTEKQQAWWKRSASRFGLDVDQQIDRKKFAILPVMKALDCQFT
jgi:superfamily II DNA or RNA helicase